MPQGYWHNARPGEQLHFQDNSIIQVADGKVITEALAPVVLSPTRLQRGPLDPSVPHAHSEGSTPTPWPVTPQVLVVTAMCTVLSVTTGSEHALATWLAPFGVTEGALGEQRMAVMSSTFWGVMCARHALDEWR